MFALCFRCIYKIGFSCSIVYCSPIIGPTRRDTTAPGPKKYEVSSASFPADSVNNDEIVGMCLCLNTEHAISSCSNKVNTYCIHKLHDISGALEAIFKWSSLCKP